MGINSQQVTVGRPESAGTFRTIWFPRYCGLMICGALSSGENSLEFREGQTAKILNDWIGSRFPQ